MAQVLDPSFEERRGNRLHGTHGGWGRVYLVMLARNPIPCRFNRVEALCDDDRLGVLCEV